jgi:hypothetical protein
VGDVGAEHDTRAGLDIGADPDDQLSEAVKTIVVSHAWHSKTWGEADR